MSRRGLLVRAQPARVEPAEGIGGLILIADLKPVVARLLPCWEMFKLSRVLHARRVLAAVVLVCLGAVCGAGAAREARAEPPSAVELARAIAAAHQQLFQLPGGLRITYHLYVAQDRRLGGFAWEDGQGRILIRWPKLYNMFEGRQARVRETNQREGEYNFVTGLSAGRDNQFVSITPYRQSWSAGHLFPLHLLFMEEADQRYVLGEDLETDYWLPSALNKGKYTWKGKTNVDGVPCDVFSREDDLDTISVAAEHSYIVCQREVRDKTRRLIESVHNTRLKEIRPKVWFPMVQAQERYSKDPTVPKWDLSKPTCVLKVVVSGVSVGGIEDKDPHIAVPKGAVVDDQILSTRYQRTGAGLSTLETGIKEGKHAAIESAARAPAQAVRLTTVVLGVLLGLLTSVTVAVGYQRVKSGGNGVGRRGASLKHDR